MPMKIRLAAALGAVLVLAGPAALAQDDGPPAPAPAPAPAPEAAPKPPEKPAETEEAFLRRITGEMLEKIPRLRGLKVKGEIERRWTTRDEMRKDMVAMAEKDMPPERRKATSRLYGLLGLLPEGSDVLEVEAAAMAGGVAGYYDPEKKVFCLVKGFSEDGSRPIVFHELTHAVEDQYYDYFDRMKKWDEAHQTDRSMAVRAVVEGSAQKFTEAFMESEPGLEERFFSAAMKEAQADGAAAMKAQLQAPPYLMIEMAMFPYHNGSRFLRSVLPRLPAPGEGEDPMARLYADPPASTEMVLHPDKYLGERDLPREVKLPEVASVLGEGWKEDHQDTMGELGLGMALNMWIYKSGFQAQLQSCALLPEGGFKKMSDTLKIGVRFRGKTAVASEGWDGDRIALYSKGEETCMAWATAWDTEQDAKEFAEVYGKVLERKYDVKPEPPPAAGEKTEPRTEPFAAGGWTGTIWKETRAGCGTAVVAKGDLVLVAERVPSGRLAGFVEALGATTVTQDPKDGIPAQKR
jgi:hypothetical protein